MEDLLDKEQQKILLDIVRESIKEYVKAGKIPVFKIKDERLNKKQGAFVTLRLEGKLRGCIGMILPCEKPLWQVVQDMALAAAAEDYRFSPVTKDELTKLDYEVSVLSEPVKIDNWQDIKLGEHGVIVEKGFNSGVFLPQVAMETGWTREEFLAHLCSNKAGLEDDSYKTDKEVKLKIFSAQVINDKDL